MITFYKNYAYSATHDTIDIYMPSGDAYFKYSLRRLIIPYRDGGTRQNQDLWRLYELYLCKRVGDSFENIYNFPVCNKGEWECAIRIVGTPDFHGGYHGYEHQTGFDINPTPSYFEFTQYSDIIAQGTRYDVIATHKKHYLFKDGSLTLTQSVDWKKSVDIDRAYMTMLPIRRKDDDFQITDTALYERKEYDVSCEGHESLRSVQNAKTVCIYGKTSGIYAQVTVDFDNNFSIQNTPAYNKFYFKYAWDRATAVGESWNTVAEYKFTYKGRI